MLYYDMKDDSRLQEIASLMDLFHYSAAEIGVRCIKGLLDVYEAKFTGLIDCSLITKIN